MYEFGTLLLLFELLFNPGFEFQLFSSDSKVFQKVFWLSALTFSILHQTMSILL